MLPCPPSLALVEVIMVEIYLAVVTYVPEGEALSLEQASYVWGKAVVVLYTYVDHYERYVHLMGRGLDHTTILVM